jgi:hypothetical protein
MKTHSPFVPLAVVVLLAGSVALGIRGGTMAAEGAPKIRLAPQEFPAGTAEIHIIPATVRISPDSKRVAYVARCGNTSLAVVDGIAGKDYDGLGVNSLIFSPDSKRVAYAAKQGNNWLAVVDTAEGKEYDGLRSLSFSPDSQRVAYAANRGRNWVVVVDGVEGKEYDRIGDIAFSPARKRVGYAACRGNNWLAVVDGVEGKEYDLIGHASLLFSPDGLRVAYTARRGQNWFVVADGVEGKLYDALGKDRFLSAERLHLAYEVWRVDPQMAALAQDQEHDTFGETGPIFSPDSLHVAYWAQRGRDWLVAVDGAESRKYDGFMRGSHLVFDSPRTLRAIAVRGRDALRVEIKILDEP